MKKNNAIYFSSALAAICLVGTPYAQKEVIGDQELLNMMDKVNDSESADVAVSTGEVAVVDVPVVEESDIAVVDAVTVEDVEVVNVDPVMDDLEIETVDEDIATKTGNLISVRLNRVSLEEAIDLFAQLSGANIIVPELTEAAQISVNLKDVEWRPALQSILDTYNYELYQRVSGSNVFSVRRRPAGAPVPQVVETFTLNYATVPNVAALVRELLPADAKISEFASRNMLVVKSTESSLSEVRAVLESIDTIRQQVYIESKFMELTDDAQKDLGINWSVLEKYGVSASANTGAYGKELTKGTPSENLFQGILGGPATAAGSGEYALMTSVLDADEFNLAMSALEQNKGVNIVSNPKIIVANEESANISIVRREPNLKQSRQAAMNDNADTVVFELDDEQPFFDFGIKLDVTPSINTSSNITVKINPSLTRKFADKEAGDNTYPIIDEKSIETVFNLASGQTAAIGGLTEITEAEEERKVPVLGSIPFIGRLFSWKQTVAGQDETIIFVTVGLANTQEQLEDMGLPEDSELARRQIIIDRNGRMLRNQDRDYFETAEEDKLEDTMRIIKIKEENRLDRRDMQLEKEAIQDAKRDVKRNS